MGVEFQLGRMVEVTETESRDLRYHTREAALLARVQGKGWMANYLSHLSMQNRIVKAIIARAHAT